MQQQLNQLELAALRKLLQRPAGPDAAVTEGERRREYLDSDGHSEARTIGFERNLATGVEFAKTWQPTHGYTCQNGWLAVDILADDLPPNSDPDEFAATLTGRLIGWRRGIPGVLQTQVVAYDPNGPQTYMFDVFRVDDSLAEAIAFELLFTDRRPGNEEEGGVLRRFRFRVKWTLAAGRQF